jgi:predicted aspartyl protease
MKLSGLCLIASGIFLFQVRLAWAQEILTVSNPPRSSAIPFRLAGGALIEVEGGIGQLEGLKFIIDTGTTRSVVDRKIVDRLALTLHPQRALSVAGFVSVEWAELPDVHFGPILMRNVSTMVSELAKFSELTGNADAIIGLDLLNASSRLGIFYDSKIVVLKPRDANSQRTLERERPRCLTVEALVQGHAVRLIVDTGMNGILIYEDRIRKQIPNLRLTDDRTDAHLGQLRGKRTKLSGFRLGERESKVEVFLMNGPREDLLPGIIGYLGTDALKARRIELDFEGENLRWQ